MVVFLGSGIRTIMGNGERFGLVSVFFVVNAAKYLAADNRTRFPILGHSTIIALYSTIRVLCCLMETAGRHYGRVELRLVCQFLSWIHKCRESSLTFENTHASSVGISQEVRSGLCFQRNPRIAL